MEIDCEDIERRQKPERKYERSADKDNKNNECHKIDATAELRTREEKYTSPFIVRETRLKIDYISRCVN